jgi:hypothetical protein
MTPSNQRCLHEIERFFKERERFTSRNMIDKLGGASGTSLTLNEQKSVGKILSNLYSLGFLKRDTENYIYHYYWTHKTRDRAIHDQPLDEKIMSDEEFDQEHSEWVKMVEQRKKMKEQLLRNIR